MQQVNLRMSPTVRYGLEHRMQIQVWRNRRGPYTLGDKSGYRIQMDRPPKTRGPFGRASRLGRTPLRATYSRDNTR